MRLWSIHPCYLDAKGLVAVWREGLLALHVLRGDTKGYTRHPQLIRFQSQSDPIAAITSYLHAIVDEAEARQYRFQRQKLGPRIQVMVIPVTSGQLDYETTHLRQKLVMRDPTYIQKFQNLVRFSPHPIFKLISGPVADWERVSK